jgi:hypothetical protein
MWRELLFPILCVVVVVLLIEWRIRHWQLRFLLILLAITASWAVIGDVSVKMRMSLEANRDVSIP